jgi:hypothetical protein
MEIFLTFLFATIYFIVVYVTDIRKDQKLVEVYQLFNSLTHGTLVSIYSYIDICAMIFFSKELEDKSFLTNWQYFSLFYFFYDMYWCIYNKTSLYIFHHLVCIIAIIYTISIDKYYNLLSIVLFIGEVTAPLFNGVKILKKFNYKSQLLFIIFATSFVLVRFIIAPLILLYIYISISSTEKYLYLITGILILVGSVFWAKGQYSYIKKKIASRLI